MIRETGISIDSRLREDNNFILHFFTSTASVLANHGLLSSREADNLRITINGIQSHAEHRASPVISQFMAQNNEFLSILTARFGQQGLCQNLLRLSLRNELSAIRFKMATLGNELLETAKLFFNQETSLFSEGVVERTVFLSSLTIDIAESVSHCIALVDSALEEYSLMIPHAMAVQSKQESDLDLEICEALGCRGTQLSLLGIIGEQNAKQIASAAIECLANILIDVTQKLVSEREVERGARLQLLGEGLRLEGQRLRDFQPTSSNNILDWESKRHAIIGQCQAISRLLRPICTEFTELLGQVGFKKKKYEVSRAVTRRIHFGLMQKGAAARDADRAADEFSRYLRQHEVDPKDLIPGEVRKIQGNLGPEALAILQCDLDRPDLKQQINEEKRRSMQRSQRLSSIFGQAMQVTSQIVLIVSFILIESCGLKLSPKSELLDFRPEIPFQGAGFYSRKESGNPKIETRDKAEKPAVPPRNTIGPRSDEK